MVDCYVIVTTRNLLWMILSVVSTLAVITGIMRPFWLFGSPTLFGNSSSNANSELFYRPSIGIYSRCRKIQRSIGGNPELNCYTYVQDFMDIPSAAWRACLFFLCFGTFLLGIAVFMSLVGFCFQSIGKKSIFSVGGVIQSVAGMHLLIV